MRSAIIDQIMLWIFIFVSFVIIFVLVIDYYTLIKTKDSCDSISSYGVRMIALGKSKEDIASELNNIKSNRMETINSSDIKCSDSKEDGKYQVIFHTSMELNTTTFKNKLIDIGGVKNIADDIILGNIDLKFSVNSYGQTLGFTETNIVNSLKPFYFKASFAKMYDDTGIVDIVFQSKNKDKRVSLDNFEITIPNSNSMVLLKDIVSFQKIDSLSQIFKNDGKRIQSITASLNGKLTSSEIYEKLKSTLDTLKNNVNIEIKGEQKENKKVIQEMIEAFIIALILIFISLVWMFDSIVKSLIILSTIPFSILGVLIGHFIMGLNLTMPGLIGIIGLAGVIVNDGIIMMDFIQKAKNLEEMKEYALLRLRPILLTSLTTILGLSSLIFFASGQSLILQPMAVALGFGIIWATVLNLYYVPMVYRVIYLNKEK